MSDSGPSHPVLNVGISSPCNTKRRTLGKLRQGQMRVLLRGRPAGRAGEGEPSPALLHRARAGTLPPYHAEICQRLLVAYQRACVEGTADAAAPLRAVVCGHHRGDAERPRGRPQLRRGRRHRHGRRAARRRRGGDRRGQQGFWGGLPGRRGRARGRGRAAGRQRRLWRRRAGPGGAAAGADVQARAAAEAGLLSCHRTCKWTLKPVCGRVDR